MHVHFVSERVESHDVNDVHGSVRRADLVQLVVHVHDDTRPVCEHGHAFVHERVCLNEIRVVLFCSQRMTALIGLETKQSSSCHTLVLNSSSTNSSLSGLSMDLSSISSIVEMSAWLAHGGVELARVSLHFVELICVHPAYSYVALGRVGDFTYIAYVARSTPSKIR